MNAPVSINPQHALKVIKVGNSFGVVLPKEVLAKLRVAMGDHLFLTENLDGFVIRAHNPAFVDAMSAAEAIMREDRDILAVLAK